MKKILALLLVTLFIGIGFSHADSVTLGWTTPPDGVVIEGYRLFKHIEGGAYDYTSPIYDGTDLEYTFQYATPEEFTVPSAINLAGSYNKETSEITLTWSQNAPNAVDKTFYFVCRAYIGEMESVDSNEVDHTFTFSDISDWKIYYSEAEAGPWTEFTTVPFSEDPHVTQPFVAVPEGQMQTIHFTVVTFGEGKNSGDAIPVSIVIDRRIIPSPPVLFKKEVTIPVQ